MTTRWEIPHDLPYTFVHERSHFPGPVRVLDFALNVKAMEEGFNAALAEYQLPLRVIDLHVGNFVYEALVNLDQPRVAKPGAHRPAARVLTVAVDELPRLWPTEWLPAIQRHLAFWHGFELERASDFELRTHFERTRERSLAMWVVHFRVFFPMLVAISRFRALCAEVLDDWPSDDVVALLTGMPSKTTEGDDVLWRLGRELRADRELTKALSAGSWSAVRKSLRASSCGRSFLGDLEAYLRDYGRRGRDWCLDRPFLVEDPSAVLVVLRTYASADGRVREARWVEQEARRVELEQACERRLAEASHPLRRAFRRLYRAARTATWLSEESYHWIEGLGSYSVRRVCLEVGSRLKNAGVLASRADVFHLQPEEVVCALDCTDREAIAKRVTVRKADFERASAIEPPPVLGTSDDAPGAPPSEIGEALDLFFGAPGEPTEGLGGLTGNGASPGVVEGPVRVIGSLDEADQVRAGDVLVAHTTSPGWTPLFRSIAALVTDTGGVLCHAAVVAREYGLPAVVGVGDATRVLRDGERVEVDGSAGTVRRVDVEDTTAAVARGASLSAQEA